MAQVEMRKETFKQLLTQFAGDAPYEIELIKLLLSQLPDNAREGFFTQYYFEHYYHGTVYILQNLNFQDDIRYMTDINQVVEYLKDYCLDEDYKFRMNQSLVNSYIRTGQPLFGILIRKEVIK